MAKLTAKIPNKLAGMRFDQCLATIFTDYSRSKLQCWIKAGRITANQLPLKAKDKVEGGELIELNAEAEAVLEYEAEDIPLDIVYEDKAILIVNKPSGLVVHPAVGNWQGTLVNALLHHDPTLKTLPRAGIVHRLDKGTSGLLMIAKTLTAYYCLSLQLKNRTIMREYLAVAKGFMTAGGTVDLPLGRHPADRTRYTVREDGKPARTHYRLEQQFKQHSLIRVKLDTGRTHQIRVHLAHIHYPLVGDSVYGGRLQLPSHCNHALKQILTTFKRQALHATRLGLQHPMTDEYCEWQIAVPKDMATLLKALANKTLD